MTNYEKIKSMSVDEMAELLSATSENIAIKLNGRYFTNEKGFIKQWLESEVEPTYCEDKENKLIHCEDCHTGDCYGKNYY